MGRLQDRLESFYKHYDADKVKSLYKDMKKSLSIYNVFKDVPKPEMTINDDKSLTFTWSEEAKQLSDEAYKRHDELYEEIYSYIGENLLGWWD